jgi:D-inositol-3-phosphate glycosyltransferase
MAIKVVITVSEDFTSPIFLREGAVTPGRLEGTVWGRFVACSSFIDAVARHGTLDYAVSPFYVVHPEAWQQLAECLPLPIVKPFDLPTLLRHDSVILHEVSRHTLSRLARLRALCALRPAPVTSQVMGLGYRSLVEELCLMLLCPIVAEDTIISPSDSATQALDAAIDSAQAILDHRGRSAARPRIKKVPLGIDTDFFEPKEKRVAREKFGIAQDEFVFLSLGRLSPIYKVDMVPILRTFRRVRDEVGAKRRVRLVIAGNDSGGRYLSLLDKTCHELGITESVTILTGFDGRDRPEIYSMADVFLGLSDTPSESFGLAMIEALSCGVPVIAAAWDGYKENIVHGTNGFLVRVHWSDKLRHLDALQLLTTATQSCLAVTQSVAIDLDDLGETMVRCVSSPASEMERLSRESLRARDRYSWRTVVAQYEDVWRELAHKDISYPPPAEIPVTRWGEVFGSFPTALLDRETLVQVSQFGSQFYKTGQQPVAYGELSAAVFEPGLANSLIRAVAEAREWVSAGALLDSFEEGQEGQIWWHILWLLKHGYMRVWSGPGQ